MKVTGNLLLEERTWGSYPFLLFSSAQAEITKEAAHSEFSQWDSFAIIEKQASSFPIWVTLGKFLYFYESTSMPPILKKGIK